jgi:hypothetical protein
LVKDNEGIKEPYRAGIIPMKSRRVQNDNGKRWVMPDESILFAAMIVGSPDFPNKRRIYEFISLFTGFTDLMHASEADADRAIGILAEVKQGVELGEYEKYGLIFKPTIAMYVEQIVAAAQLAMQAVGSAA